MSSSSANPPPNRPGSIYLSKSFLDAAKINKRKAKITTLTTLSLLIPTGLLWAYSSYEQAVNARRRKIFFLKERAIGETISEQLRCLEVERNNETRDLELKIMAPPRMQQETGDADILDSMRHQQGAAVEEEKSSAATFFAGESSPTTSSDSHRDRSLLNQYLQERIDQWVNTDEHQMDKALINSVCSHMRVNYQMSCRKHFETFYPELLEAAVQNRTPQTMYVESYMADKMTRKEELAWAFRELIKYVKPGGQKAVYQRFWWAEDEV